MTELQSAAKVLLIDNYDSFTYNLRDYLLQLGVFCEVIRNDAVSFEELKQQHFDAVVFSPGPQTPLEAGFLMEAVAWYIGRCPVLGVCLGHQAIGMHFGARLVRAQAPVHGKTSMIQHNGHELFSGIPSNFEVMRYHSLILEHLEGTPLMPIAYTIDAELMAFAHQNLPVAGVQFHPESILTPNGMDILRNWLKWVEAAG